ncbi:CHRD domain-containing protein [Massilia sp. LC238]|uniref:CHRD domain-containing protein n=1 Tax=Massilia sp. LC238 TaxID=1502852 RepID=UPI0004E31BAF|nr:CHRD domain-containing protein [Massilia sp. LC238]KFC68855.1 PEP-exosortase interaction domain containing protein [Massilia sp. LC238]
MKKVLSALALAASTLALAPAAQAADIYRAVSSGPAESPPNGSPGSSVATIEIDGTTLRAEVPFQDLLASTTAAHIHCCTTEAFTGVAPVAIPLAGFPLMVTAGSYNATLDLGDPAVYDPAFLASFGGTASGAGSALLDAMNANQAYLNIYTTRYPNGEIRGFVVAAPIPEPATWGMLGIGLAGLALMARRRPGSISQAPRPRA